MLCLSFNFAFIVFQFTNKIFWLSKKVPIKKYCLETIKKSRRDHYKIPIINLIYKTECLIKLGQTQY